MKGSNHGRDTFAKEGDNAQGAVIYYWDNRDGEGSRGWWIGIGVGGQQVWAHNTAADMTPPRTGWRVP